MEIVSLEILLQRAKTLNVNPLNHLEYVTPATLAIILLQEKNAKSWMTSAEITPAH